MATDLLINKNLKKMCKEIDYKIEEDLEKSQNDKEFNHYDITLSYKGRTIEIFYGQNKECPKPICYDIIIIYMDYGNDGATNFTTFCKMNGYNIGNPESKEIWELARWAKYQMQYLLGDDLHLFLKEIFEEPF